MHGKLSLKRTVLPAMIALVLGCSGLEARAQSVSAFDLPAQPLVDSLKAVANLTHVNVFFEPKLVAGLRAPALKAQLSTDEALRQLLQGTGLTLQKIDDHTIAVTGPGVAISEPNSAPAHQAIAPTTTATSGTKGYTRLAQAEADPSAQGERNESQNSEAGNSSRASAEAEKNRVELEEIVVVGTNIRGVYPSSSPVEIYTAEDIARTGATTTEQFIQKLPQNLGTRTQYAAAVRVGTGVQNYASVSSVDLRGLGAGTTLTLMNGRRLGLSDSGRSADVSMIPVSAIQRVEVLTDGASAIYGSDAVGGVINFVLRDDFDGAETRASYGEIADGGMRQGEVSQTLGTHWSSGHGLISYDYLYSTPLDRLERAYAAPAGRGTLTPDERRHSALATFTQNLSEQFALSGDFVFAKRDVKNEISAISSANPLAWTFLTASSDTKRYFANLALDYQINPRFNASLKTSYSEVDVSATNHNLSFNLVPPTFTLTPADSHHKALDLTAQLDGTAFTLPGGEVKFSLGGGALEEEFSGTNPATGRPNIGRLSRRTTYAYSELFAPLIGASQGIPLAHRLELTVAARYTRYDDTSNPALNRDFGDAIDPKVGLLWAPIPSLNVRGTYGTSFRAPTLVELDPTNATNQFVPATIANQAAIRMTVVGFSDIDLAPEEAETYTFGFDYHPTSYPKLRIGVTYYNIDYTNRIAVAPNGGLNPFTNPTLLPDLIYRAPSAAYIESLLQSSTNTANFSGVSLDPVANQDRADDLFRLPNLWIFDNRFRNLALSRQDGIDLSVNNSFDVSWGEIRVGTTVTRILDYEQQSSARSAAVSVINSPLLPVDLRGRVFGGVSVGGFDGNVSVNYVDHYENRLVTGARDVRSWTTVDLNLSYRFDAKWSDLLDGFRLSLSAQNLFDKDPPFLDPGPTGLLTPIGFDPANANPLGRFVSLGLVKNW